MAWHALRRLTAQSPLRVWLRHRARGNWRAQTCSLQPVACGARRGGEDVGSRMGWLWASRASGRSPPPAWRSDAGSGARRRGAAFNPRRGDSRRLASRASCPASLPTSCYSVGKSGSRMRSRTPATKPDAGGSAFACRAKGHFRARLRREGEEAVKTALSSLNSN